MDLEGYIAHDLTMVFRSIAEPLMRTNTCDAHFGTLHECDVSQRSVAGRSCLENLCLAPLVDAKCSSGSAGPGELPS